VSDDVTVPSGLVAVYKPKDWSSFDVVARVRGILSRGMEERCKRRFKIKVGHGGTLDPLAEGVLVLGIGEGTKLMGEYLSGSKAYHAVAKLGEETDTLDCTGVVTAAVDCAHINENILNDALQSYRGQISQMPPMFSALKKDGKKLYELAREGIEVERQPRNVTVYSLQLLPRYNEDWLHPEDSQPVELPYFGLNVECSGGFYVRSLISDLGKSCGGRAHMTALRRVKQGQFELQTCLPQTQWNFEDICLAIAKSSAGAGLPVLKPAATGQLIQKPPQ
jgi:tRNA pseudouridine55 synthase